MTRSVAGRKSKTQLTAWLRLLPLVALWAVPVVAVAVAVPLVTAREEQSVSAPLPTEVIVGSQSTDYRTAVTTSVQVGEVGQVRSALSGLLTSLDAVTGESVRPGQVLFSVDGVPVLAQPGNGPLYRELKNGDKGADVEILSRFLVEAGFMTESFAGGTFGPGIRAGVVSLQKSIGSEADGIFRPHYVTYIPESAGVIADNELTVGDVVSVGDTVFSTTAPPTRITFTPAGAAASLHYLQDTPLQLTFGDITVPVSGLSPNGNELATIYSTLSEASNRGEIQTNPTEPGSPKEYTGGLLRRAEAEERGVVPGTSIYVSSAGAQCLFVAGADGKWNVMPIEEIEPAVGTLGTVYVDATLVDARVARNPPDLGLEVLGGCG